MIQKVEDIKPILVGRLGDITTSHRLVVYAYQGVTTGKFYGLIVDDLRSGDDQKARTIMFSDLKMLEEIADKMSNKQEPSREL